MENRFIRAEDVAQELNVSKPYAYALKMYDVNVNDVLTWHAKFMESDM